MGELVDGYTRDVLSRKKPEAVATQAPHLAWRKEKLGAYALADIALALLAEYRGRLVGETLPPKTPNSEPRYRAALHGRARLPWRGAGLAVRPRPGPPRGCARPLRASGCRLCKALQSLEKTETQAVLRPKPAACLGL